MILSYTVVGLVLIVHHHDLNDELTTQYFSFAKFLVVSGAGITIAKVAKGTTNSDPCLVNPAIATAKTFKWQPDANAPDTQIGFVVVNFQVGE